MELSLAILSPKYFRNEKANREGEPHAGRQVEDLRQSKESRADQSFLGCFE